MAPPKLSEVLQVATMVVVLWSLIEAFHYGNQNAMRVWIEGWEGLATVLYGGIGMKMTHTTVERIAARKYGRPAGIPDGEEP